MSLQGKSTRVIVAAIPVPQPQVPEPEREPARELEPIARK
jgi:hypothetical protein